jgi:hypothetical protein
MMADASDAIVILSSRPGLWQSLAVANLLRRHVPDVRLLGYPLTGEKGGLRGSFDRYVSAQEAEPAMRHGTAIVTGSEASDPTLKYRDS